LFYHQTENTNRFISNDKKHQNLTRFLKIIFISKFVKRREAANKKRGSFEASFSFGRIYWF